jgi:hypothetical protein
MTRDRDANDDSDDNPLAEILDEIWERLQRGESVTLAEFQRRHPSLARDGDQILARFQLMARATCAFRHHDRRLTDEIG